MEIKTPKFKSLTFYLLLVVVAACFAPPAIAAAVETIPGKPAVVPHISTDKSIRYDYDIVYVRAPRHGDEKMAKWAEFSDPIHIEPGADLMLLHPDGSEEKLVDGQSGSVMDPYVSFDGQSVYYAKFIDAKQTGADIYKIHIPTRKIIRLTNQTFTPNTGAANWSSDMHTPEKGKTALNYGVYNLGPCPAPGGKIGFTSNRNAHVPPRGYPKVTLQLFVMDDDGTNVEQIGYINIGCALHPTILTDGRILFSSLESEGLHNAILWAIWSIHPDGTNWEPVVSSFWPGGAPPGFHFQAQLSDTHLILEQYYNQNNSGFGTFMKMPLRPPAGTPAFGPASLADPRNAPIPYGNRRFQMPFSPYGLEVVTRFASSADEPAPTFIKGEQMHPRHKGQNDGVYPHAVGKVTHPSGAPDNHLLAVWSPGPDNHNGGYYPLIDGGLYLIKNGQPIDRPEEMLLIKNDPDYNEQWPRALVPYDRIYGIKEPKQLTHHNDGKYSPHLPEGTPFGLVGTSSLYKRESATGGKVIPGTVTAVGTDKRQELGWWLQGSDAGFYDNSEIHAIRIVAQEPRTDVNGNKSAPLYGSHGNERLRILGEIPVRKFDSAGKEPLDPDNNPDTSFLIKIPADQAFTFQTLNKDGLVLTTAQTWHQLRPGEARYNCGGCHAHSQSPTPFDQTAAARKDYTIADLSTSRTPLLTTKSKDESGHSWDKEDQTGLRYETGIKNVEYRRDIKPILQRSCIACHTQKSEKPAGNLVLDDDDKSFRAVLATSDTVPSFSGLPGPYYHLAGEITNRIQASRYIVKFQARKSLLMWKIFGRRLDGLSNDEFPSEEIPGDLTSIRWKGKRIDKLNYEDKGALQRYLRDNGDIDYLGTQMPPPEAIAGTYKTKDGQTIKVPALSDEDRSTMARWIDLGCPIDLDPNYDPADPAKKSHGWMGDDQRPTLALTYPAAGANPPLSRILIGMCDAYTGLDLPTFTVTADIAIDGAPAGENLASRFQQTSPGIWEMKLAKPLNGIEKATLITSIKDRQGNIARVERTFSAR